MSRTFAYCLVLCLYACDRDAGADSGARSDGGVDACGAAPHTGCAPEVDGTNFGLEGDALDVELHCADGRALAKVGVCPGVLPDGAAYDGKHALRWTPRLDQAGIYAIGRGVIEVADRWSALDNAPIADPLHYTEEYGLPVFQLWTGEDFGEDEHTPVRLVYGGREYVGVEAKYRGQTSYNYPKKSFTVKFAKSDLFTDAKHGFVDPRRRVVLTTTFDDKSSLRQRMAFDLWNRLQPTVEVAAYSAVLYLNGQYHGLYTVTDHVDDDLGEMFGLYDDSNLYKARTHAANLKLTDENGATKDPLELGYTKEEGEPEDDEPGAFDDLRELIGWVATASDDSFADELEERLDRRDFENWLLLVSVIDARDSAGKNGYLFHDPRPGAPDARWHYVPWDFNASFGQSWRTVRIASTSPLERYIKPNALFERMFTMPALSSATAARYADAMQHAWLVGDVLSLFDAHTAEIAAAAHRDEEKWQQQFLAYDFGDDRTDVETFDEEVEYVRAYIEARWTFVNAQYP